MKRRTKILLALGLVSLFALAFVFISASPGRRIPPRSIVLLDRSAVTPIMVLSNATSRIMHIQVRVGVKIGTDVNRMVPIQSLRLEAHKVARCARPIDPFAVMVSEEERGLQRLVAAARIWLKNRSWRDNPFAKQHTYFGHYVEITPELLNGSANPIAKGRD